MSSTSKNLKKSLTHRLNLEKNQFKRLNKRTSSTSTWADRLLVWVAKKHGQKELGLVKAILKRGYRHPIQVARHNGRAIETLQQSKVLVVSQVGALPFDFSVCPLLKTSKTHVLGLCDPGKGKESRKTI